MPLAEAPLRIFTDVGLNRNSAERHRALAQLGDCAHVDFLPERVSQREVWQRYARYPFVLSATGNALDCHRTWEALYLGATVIAMHSPLDPLYEGLPVVLVHDWGELRDAANLARWREHFAPLADPANLAQRLHPQTWLAPLRAALHAG
ncbi:MAG: hypothetical protein Q8O82_06150 [Pseudorhodobacter sp.]|nr:hypothetical protein [Pseudorhodobacter sp.]